MAQYIGVNSRFDVSAGVKLIEPGSESTTIEEFKSIKKSISHLKDTSEIVLNFVPLDMNTVKILVITDAYFSNARNMRSKLIFIVLMTEKTATPTRFITGRTAADA